MLHPDEVIPGNESFNEYAKKLTGKGMKPLSLNYYLKMDANERIYYKRIKKVFEYDQNQAAIINIFPSKREEEEAKKKDGFIKRIIKKVLNKESITPQEEIMLTEVMKNED